MDVISLSLLILSSTVIGILIGGVGIGGVLLVPILTYVLKIDIHVAIATAILSYVVSGAIGTWVFARKGSIKWNMTFCLFMGAAPGAFLGAFLTSLFSSTGLEIFIAFLIMFAGINSLLKPKKIAFQDKILASSSLIVIGFITGVGSALSGTGGPLILVPILVWLRVAPLQAVGLSQVIQIPIAILATAGNYLHGTVDFINGTIIAVSMATGVFFGARGAHLLTQNQLGQIVAWILLGVGIFIIVRAFLQYNFI